MSLDAKQLIKAKRHVADVASAVDSGDMTNLSQDGQQLLFKLFGLEDADWDPLMASLEDTELREQLGSLRRDLGGLKDWLPIGALSRIRTVGHLASFDFVQSSLAIGLVFKTSDKSLVSSQDLEDTLWIGAAVVQAVSEAMMKMEGTLSLEAQQSCIGKVFQDNLKNVEAAAREIRRIYTAISDADGPDQAG